MTYIAATPLDVKTRYPSFAGVDDAVIQFWLTDALRFVSESWIETDRAPAEQAYAAHQLALQGAGQEDALPRGVTQFRSGTFAASISDEASTDDILKRTRYGEDFITLRKRSFSGPRIYV